MARNAPTEYGKTVKLSNLCNFLKILFEINETENMVKFSQFYIKALSSSQEKLCEDYTNFQVFLKLKKIGVKKLKKIFRVEIYFGLKISKDL